MPKHDTAPEGANPEINFDIAERPWSDHPRLTRAEFRVRAASEGKVVQLGDYTDHLRFSDRELELLYDQIESRRESHFIDELGPKFVIREYGNKPRVGWFNDRGELATMSFDDFSNAHIEKTVEVGVDLQVSPRGCHWSSFGSNIL